MENWALGPNVLTLFIGIIIMIVLLFLLHHLRNALLGSNEVVIMPGNQSGNVVQYNTGTTLQTTTKQDIQCSATQQPMEIATNDDDENSRSLAQYESGRRTLAAPPTMSSRSGNFVGTNLGSLKMVTVLNQQLQEPATPAKDLKYLDEKVKESIAWDDHLDILEHRSDQCLDQKETRSHLAGILTEDEKAILPICQARDQHHFDKLVTALRWWPNLRMKVMELLPSEESGETVENETEITRSTCSRRCSTLNEAFLRMAITDVATDIDRLPRVAIRTLYDAGVLLHSDLHQLENGEHLWRLLLVKHEPELRQLRCLLRWRYPNVFSALLRAYLNANEGHRWLSQVPPPPLHFVPRPGYMARVRNWLSACHEKEEARVRNWLSACHEKEGALVLVLHGLSSIGKSTLGAALAREAVSYGFHEVVWADAAEPCLDVLRSLARQLEAPAGGQTEAAVAHEIRAAVCQLQDQGDRLLVVLDDLSGAALWRHLEPCRYVLVTSRHDDCANHSKAAVTKVEVGEGLTRDESRQLLASAMGPSFAELEERQMTDAALDLCEENFHMPISVNIIGNKLRLKAEKWRVCGLTYLDTVRKELADARAAWQSADSNMDLRQHTGDSYRYATVYAAIRSSIDDLSKTDRERYFTLAVFERGDPIVPPSMVVMWGDDTAETRLDLFVTHSILQSLRFEHRWEEFVYRLHDLQWTVLQALPGTQKEMMRKKVFQRYQDSIRSVKDVDVFFYRRFVSLSLSLREVSTARKHLTRFAFLLKRLRADLADGLLTDYRQTLGAGDPNSDVNEKLRAYRDLMDITLAAAVASQDPEMPLRVALYRPHECVEFEDAVRHVKDARPFSYLYRHVKSPIDDCAAVAPAFSLTVEPRHLQFDHITSVDLAEDYSCVLIGCASGRVLYYETECTKITARTDGEEVTKSRVLFVRFLTSPPCAKCLVVTSLSILLLEVVQSREGGDGLTKSFKSRCRVALDKECEAAILENNYLWTLDKNDEQNRKRLQCFMLRIDADSTSLQVQMRKEFEFETCLVTELVISSSGQVLGLSASSAAQIPISYLVSIDDTVMKYLPKTVEIFGFIRERPVIRKALPDAMCCIVDEDLTSRGPFINGSYLPSQILKACITDSDFALVSEDTGRFFLSSPDGDKEPPPSGRLAQWPSRGRTVNLRKKEMFWCRQRLVFRGVHDMTLRVYAFPRLTDLARSSATRDRQQRRVLGVQWLTQANDFLLVAVEDRRLHFRLLRSDSELLTDSFIASLVSISDRRVLGVKNKAVKVWRLHADRNQLRITTHSTINFKQRVIAVCQEEDTIVAAVLEDGKCVFYKSASEEVPERLFALHSDAKRWRPTGLGSSLQLIDRKLICCGIKDCRGRALSVWTLEGELVVSLEGIFDFSTAARRLAVSQEQNLEIWDLTTRTQIPFQFNPSFKTNITSMCLSQDGRRLLYTSNVGEVVLWLRVLSIDDEQIDLSPKWKSNVVGQVQVLSESCDGQVAFVREKDRIHAIDLASGRSQVIVLDSWLGATWVSSECWLSPDLRFIALQDKISNIKVFQKVDQKAL